MTRTLAHTTKRLFRWWLAPVIGLLAIGGIQSRAAPQAAGADVPATGLVCTTSGTACSRCGPDRADLDAGRQPRLHVGIFGAGTSVSVPRTEPVRDRGPEGHDHPQELPAGGHLDRVPRPDRCTGKRRAQRAGVRRDRQPGFSDPDRRAKRRQHDVQSPQASRERTSTRAARIRRSSWTWAWSARSSSGRPPGGHAYNPVPRPSRRELAVQPGHRVRHASVADGSGIAPGRRTRPAIRHEEVSPAVLLHQRPQLPRHSRAERVPWLPSRPYSSLVEIQPHTSDAGIRFTTLH